MVIHWEVLLLGFASGLGVSVLFFAGLGLGVRVALRSGRPTAVLALSALCRIAVLLCVGYAVTVLAGDAWAAAGYAAGFFLVRLIAIVRVGPAAAPTLS